MPASHLDFASTVAQDSARTHGSGSVRGSEHRSAAVARYRARRERERIFGDALFADPAWDILLHLFILSSDRKRSTVSEVCAASAVPATTALRCIATLERTGLIERNQHPNDRRSFTLELTPEGADKMTAFFDAAEQTSERPARAAAPWFPVAIPAAIRQERITFRR